MIKSNEIYHLCAFCYEVVVVERSPGTFYPQDGTTGVGLFETGSTEYRFDNGKYHIPEENHIFRAIRYILWCLKLALFRLWKLTQSVQVWIPVETKKNGWQNTCISILYSQISCIIHKKCVISAYFRIWIKLFFFHGIWIVNIVNSVNTRRSINNIKWCVKC